MSKYDIGWRESARLRAGLYWQGNRPSLRDYRDGLMQFIAGFAAALIFFLVVGLLDAHDARVTAQVEAEQATSNFANFLNGGIITDQAGTFAAKCAQMLEVTQ